MFDERVSNDVPLVEFYDSDAFDVAEAFESIAETGLLRGRQVDLRHITRDNHLAAYSEACEEHLELECGGVLRLVEDDDSVGERPSAHKREGCNLNRAFLHVFRQFSGRNHILQGIVERLDHSMIHQNIFPTRQTAIHD